MRTAKEILKKNTTGYRGSIKQTDAIKAMEEYADQFKSKWISVEDGLPEIDDETGFSTEVIVKLKTYTHGIILVDVGWLNCCGKWDTLQKEEGDIIEWMLFPSV